MQSCLDLLVLERHVWGEQVQGTKHVAIFSIWPLLALIAFSSYLKKLASFAKGINTVAKSEALPWKVERSISCDMKVRYNTGTTMQTKDET